MPFFTKQNNRSDILSLIMARQPISRKDVAALQGLSPAAVSNIVDELIGKDLVVEGITGESTARGGRKPIFLRFNQDAAYVVAASMRLHNPQIFVCDLMGKEIDSCVYSEQQFDSFSVLFEKMTEDIRRLVQKNGGRERFAGVGISIPGIVEKNVVCHSPELGLMDFPLAAYLEEKLDLPVYIDKDIYISALGENWMGAGREYSDFVTVTVGTGIGSAVILSNHIYRGFRGMAGEIGYLTTGLDALENPPFTHTDFGYFENSASVRSVRRDTGVHFKEAVAKAKEGDGDWASCLSAQVDRLCLGLGNVISLLNPQALILTGSYADAAPLVLEPIQKRLEQLTPIRCQVSFSTLGSKALVYGCVATVLQERYEMQFFPRK